MSPKTQNRKGIVTISILIGFMTLVLLSSIAITSVSFNQLDVTQISNDGVKALIYAEAGAKDALQRITKDISYTTSSSTYNLPVASTTCPASLSGCAKVRVDSTISPKIITVIGYSGLAERKIQVDVPYDSSYKITNTFWNEIKNLPTISTGAATSVASTTATINGWSNPNGNSVTGWFRYSPTEPANCSDDFGLRQPTSGGDALSGTDPASFSENLTGLTSGATYYYCAIGSDGGSPATKVYGQVFSFTATGTLIGGPIGLPPTVTTSPATDINDAFGNFSVTLNGSASPNGFSTTGWFRYWTSNPLICSDALGTRVPSSGGTSLGAGGTAVPYSESVSLLPETTYFFCALASNSVATGVGLIESFTTPAAFSSGMAITNSGSGGDTRTVFVYKRSGEDFTKVFEDDTIPGNVARSIEFSNDDKYLVVTHGTTSPYLRIYKRSGTTFTELEAPLDTPPPSDSVGAWNAKFSPDDKYLAVAHNGFPYLSVYRNNRDDTFSKLSVPLGPAGIGRGVSFSSDGTYLAVAHQTSPYLSVYTHANDVFTKVWTAANGELASYGTGVSFSNNDSHLAVTTLGSPYVGIYKLESGEFTKLANPVTLPGNQSWYPAFSADDTYLSIAHIRNSDPASLTIYERSGDTFTKLVSPDGPNVVNPGGDGKDIGFSLDGEYMALTHASTPFITIYNNVGDGTFTTLSDEPDELPPGRGQYVAFTNVPDSPTAPKAFTYEATDVFFTEATLNGSGNPQGASATGYFRYCKIGDGGCSSAPTVCNDTFGDRAPASGGEALGNGVSTVEYSQAITGLLPVTTYYFCAISSNAMGTSFGKVSNFTTTIITAPTVTTVAASSINATTATLNGTANPNGGATLGYFRYSTTNPVICNDLFGTRVPGSGGDTLGSGASAVAFNEPVTGLSENTTYYFCAIASNSAGISFGSVESFTTNKIIGDWIAIDSGTTTDIRAIAYSSDLSRFVIGMSNGTNRYSDNGGATWLAGNTVPLGAGGSSPIIQNLEWSDNYDLFIATGTQVIAASTTAAVWTSADGITWSTPTTLQGSSALAIADGGTILISGNSNSTGGATGRSIDGTTWTAGGAAAAARHTGAAWSPDPLLGVFVLVSEGGFIDTSIDGVAWTAENSGTSASFAHVAYSPTLNQFLAVTMTGTSRTSTDGSAWTPGSTGVAASNTRKTRWISPMFLSATNTNGRFDRRDTPTSAVIVVDTSDGSAPFDIATDGSVLVAVYANGHIRTAPLSQ